MKNRHLGARGQLRHQVLFEAIPVFRDERIHRPDDFGRRAIVLRHQDGFRSRKFPIEIKEELHPSPAPGINRLIRIPDDEEILVVSRQNRHQFVLQGINVLELVHHHVGDPLLPLLPHRFVFFEN